MISVKWRPFYSDTRVLIYIYSSQFNSLSNTLKTLIWPDDNENPYPTNNNTLVNETIPRPQNIFRDHLSIHGEFFQWHSFLTLKKLCFRHFRQIQNNVVLNYETLHTQKNKNVNEHPPILDWVTINLIGKIPTKTDYLVVK